MLRPPMLTLRAAPGEPEGGRREEVRRLLGVCQSVASYSLPVHSLPRRQTANLHWLLSADRLTLRSSGWRLA